MSNYAEFKKIRVVTRLRNRYAYRLVLIPLLLLAGNSYAGKTHSIDSSLSTFITSFPFITISGGVMIISAKLDSFPDSLHFVLDTGSGGISLDSALVSELQLPAILSDRTLLGIGSSRRISYVMDRTLRLPNLDVDHLNFHINDYFLLTSSYGIRIDGIIGYSFFKQFIVKINYDKNVIEVWTNGSIKYPRSGYMIRPDINGIPSFKATVNDGRVCLAGFFFDTGAGLSLLMSEDFERDSTILTKNKKQMLVQVEGLGTKKQVKITLVKQVKIGPYKFKKIPSHIFKDDYNVTAYPRLGGLIGNDLLRRFNLVINYAENEIHLQPNSHFNDNFDYSYTGLSIYLSNGEIIVEDVQPNSPGDKAGVKPGDIVIAMDNTFYGTIQAYKDIMQQTGERIKIVVLRDKQPHIFFVKVKNLLREIN